MEIRMTDALVPPPEHAHLRWHWLKDGISDPVPFQWINSYWEMGGARIWPGMAGNWRYHSPCDPNAVTLDPDAIATRILNWVMELSDRTSPEDWPEAMLVTGEELVAIVKGVLGEVK